MNRTKKLFIIIILLALGLGCAKKGEREAILSFQLGASFDSNGGAMLWGHNKSTGENFAEVISVNADVSKILPLNDFEFWVVAWAG